jgi:hypothetical protein
LESLLTQIFTQEHPRSLAIIVADPLPFDVETGDTATVEAMHE